MGYTSRVVFTIAFLLLLASANTVFAQTPNVNQTLLQSSYVNAACKINFTTTYLSRVTASVPSLSFLGQYSASLQGDASRLSALAAAGNITAYKNYVSGTYDPDLNRIAKNASSAIRAANLTANTIAALRQNYSITLSSYKLCNM